MLPYVIFHPILENIGSVPPQRSMSIALSLLEMKVSFELRWSKMKIQ